MPFSTILCNFGFIGMLVSVAATLGLSSPCLPVCGLDRLLMVAIGLVSFLAQILLTVSLQFASAGKVSLERKAFDIICSFGFQIFLFWVRTKTSRVK